jgi:hypothetical protein
MIKSIGLLVAGVLCVGACNVEHYDDCTDDDDFEFEDDFERGPRAGSSSKAGSSGNDAGGSSSGGSSSGGSSSGGSSSGGSSSGGSSSGGSSSGGSGGSGGATEPPPTPCDEERDCDAGYNCNIELGECQPADAETCGELDSEGECAERGDCIPVYGGTNCSCGQDCECQGGEPGCVCESFEFFVCRASE